MATTTLYLDDRVIRKDGCASVKIVLRNRGTVAHFPIGIAVPPQCWKEGKVVLSKNKAIDALLPAKPLVLNNEIRTILSKVNLIVTQICGLKSNISAALLRSKVQYALEGRSMEKDACDLTFLECFEEFVQSHTKESTRRTLRIPIPYIRKAMRKSADIRLADIDEEWAEALAKVLREGNSYARVLAPNTASNYLCVIKAVWHYAQKKKYVPKSEDPFSGIVLQKVATKSRALEVEDVRKIWFYDPEKEGDTGYCKHIKVIARDMFRLTVCLCGINIADLYELKESAIRSGRLETDRVKTGVHINIRLEPEALEIIEKYKAGGYLIGKLREGGKTAMRTRINYALGKHIPGLTSYWARHSWASLAVELDIPDRTVFMGLAHKQGKYSDETYITMRNRKLDIANRKILDYIIGNNSL